MKKKCTYQLLVDLATCDHGQYKVVSLFTANRNIEKITIFAYSCAQYTLVERGRGGGVERERERQDPLPYS